MSDAALAVVIIAFLSSIIAVTTWIVVSQVEDYPANPLKWRSERRRRVQKSRVQRISALEHDLGYIPCSNDECYSCNPYPYKGIAMRASSPYNGMKKIRKTHRAPARKAV